MFHLTPYVYGLILRPCTKTPPGPLSFLPWYDLCTYDDDVLHSLDNAPSHNTYNLLRKLTVAQLELLHHRK